MKVIPVLLLTLFCQDQGRTKLYWWPASLFLPSTLLFPSLPPQMSPRSVYRWDATSSPAAWRKGTTSTLSAASSPTLYVIIHIASSVTLSFNKFWRSSWLCSLSYHKMACIDFLFFRLSVFIGRIIFSLLPLFRCLHCAFNFLMPLPFTLSHVGLSIFSSLMCFQWCVSIRSSTLPFSFRVSFSSSPFSAFLCCCCSLPPICPDSPLMPIQC